MFKHRSVQIVENVEDVWFLVSDHLATNVRHLICDQLTNNSKIFTQKLPPALIFVCMIYLYHMINFPLRNICYCAILIARGVTIPWGPFTERLCATGDVWRVKDIPWTLEDRWRGARVTHPTFLGTSFWWKRSPFLLHRYTWPFSSPSSSLVHILHSCITSKTFAAPQGYRQYQTAQL